MGWHQVSGFECSASTQTDNRFASPRSQATGKMSVKLPSDHRLCRKVVTEGYSSHRTDTNGLFKNQFVTVNRTQRWHDVFLEKKDFSQAKVTFCHNEPAKIDSVFTRIARPSQFSGP